MSLFGPKRRGRGKFTFIKGTSFELWEGNPPFYECGLGSCGSSCFEVKEVVFPVKISDVLAALAGGK